MKALHLNFEGESKHVVSSRGTAYLRDKIHHVTLKIGEYEILSSVNLGRSVNSHCGSDQRTSGIESCVWFRRFWRSVSQRRMPRETEKHKQEIFQPHEKATMQKD